MKQQQASVKNQKIQKKASQPPVRSKVSDWTPKNPYLQPHGIIGNHGVLQRYRSNVMQAKLIVGSPNDRYEQEADRVATEIFHNVTASHGQLHQQPGLPVGIEKKQSDTAQNWRPIRVTPMPRKTATHDESITPGLDESIRERQNLGQDLPPQLSKTMERTFGLDLRGIKIHTDTVSDKLNRSLNATAFTVGHNIFFRAGEYNPWSDEGFVLIAHEVTHVAQQKTSNIEGNSEPQFLQCLMHRPLPEWGTEPRQTNRSAMVFDPWAGLCRENQCVSETFTAGQSSYNLAISPENTPCTANIQLNTMWLWDNIEGEDLPVISSIPQDIRRQIDRVVAVGNLSGSGYAVISTEVLISTLGRITLSRPVVEDQGSSGYGARMEPIDNSDISIAGTSLCVMSAINGEAIETLAGEIELDAFVSPTLGVWINIPQAVTWGPITFSLNITANESSTRPMTASIYFAVRSDGLSLSASRGLLSWYEGLSEDIQTGIRNGSIQIVIYGYASTTNTSVSDMDLSERRASYVSSVLAPIATRSARESWDVIGRGNLVSQGLESENPDSRRVDVLIDVPASSPMAGTSTMIVL